MSNSSITYSAITMCIIGAIVNPALAITANGDARGESAITMIVEGEGMGDGDTDIMDITVPAVIPLMADTDGKIAIPNNVKIINNSNKHSVQIVELVAENRDWELVDYDVDLSGEADNAAKLGLRINGDKIDREGKISLNEGKWWIDKSGELVLDIEAKIPRQTEASKREAVNIQYTVDWGKDKTANTGIFDLQADNDDKDIIKDEDNSTHIENPDTDTSIGTETDEDVDSNLKPEDVIEPEDDEIGIIDGNLSLGNAE